MAAEPAYRLGNLAEAFAGAPSSAPGSDPERRFGVQRTGSPAQTTTPILVTAAKMAVIVLVVVTALAFARIALTNATVVTMIEADSISSQITQARSSGVSLEMEQSVLSNTSAIKAAAKRLGMAAPYEVETIALTPDIVATGDDGALSLSETVGNLVQAQG